jgi:aryl-alcohol dehydrogenase-like predicted oxidoreductase
MNYRSLGRTGVSVSPYCPGATMFGAVGNPDHDGSMRGMTLVPMATAFVTRHPAVTYGAMFRVSTEGGSVMSI